MALDVAGGVAQAGGVDEAEGDAIEVEGLFDGVAGGAGLGADDGAVGAEEGVEKGGLAGVRGTGEDDEGALAEEAALTPGGKEGVGAVGKVGETFAGLVGEVGRELAFIEVQQVLDVCGEGEGVVVERREGVGEAAVEVGAGGLLGAGGLGGDEVGDGFGLSEVEASIEEGAAGEFAGAGGAGAQTEEGVEDALGHDGAAVDAEFDGILAGVGVGRAIEEKDGVIEGFTFGAAERGVGEGAGGAVARRGRESRGQAVGDGVDPLAAQADEGDAAESGGGGEGRDGLSHGRLPGNE